MKKKLITILAVMLLLVFTLGASAVWAEPADGDDGYKYRVEVFSGNQGTYKSKKHWSDEYAPGESVEISIDDVTVTNDRYYVRGFRATGHDNDETTGAAQLTFKPTTDLSFVVTYGIKGAMVAYEVNYQDESGQTLSPSSTYYGMPGDKPVVSCKYIEGYQPDADNLAKTLSENEAENVFTFTYTKLEAGGGGNNGQNSGGGQNANGGTAGGAGGAAGNAAAAATINDGAVPGTNFTDLDDNQTPLSNLDDQDTPLGGLFSGAIAALLGIIIAGILIVLALLYFILRRRRDEEEE